MLKSQYNLYETVEYLQEMVLYFLEIILLASHINNPISNAVSSIYYKIKTYIDPLTVKSCFVQKNSYLLLYSDCQFFHFISQDLFLNFLETEWQRKLDYMLSLFSLYMQQMDAFLRKQ